MKDKAKAAVVATKNWAVRWQEPVFWLPLLALVCFVGWTVIGALDNTATTDMLGAVLEVPIRCLMALGWLAMVYLARRRFRRRLSDEEQDALWQGCMRGERGPLILYITDVLVWVLAGLALLPFFLR